MILQNHRRMPPLIPLRTPHLTLASVDPLQQERHLLTSEACRCPLTIDGSVTETLVLEVVVTAELITLGFVHVGARIYYQSFASPLALDYAVELLQAVLHYSFFIFNNTTVEWLLDGVDNPLLPAYHALQLPGSPLAITEGTVMIMHRSDFYQGLLPPTELLTLAAVAVLLRADGAILLSQPGQRETTAWELPGGKMAAGETPTTALVRELQEELGINILPDSLIPLTFATESCLQQQLLVHCYLCCNGYQEPEAREQQSLAWVQPPQIHHYPMQVAHQVTFYQIAYLLGRYSPLWAQYAQGMGAI